MFRHHYYIPKHFHRNGLRGLIHGCKSLRWNHTIKWNPEFIPQTYHSYLAWVLKGSWDESDKRRLLIPWIHECSEWKCSEAILYARFTFLPFLPGSWFVFCFFGFFFLNMCLLLFAVAAASPPLAVDEVPFSEIINKISRTTNIILQNGDK